ncbi:MAG: DedA family protein [Holosporales bacterium]|nr:DedA family protein [Holosporales bacterium]
MSFEEIIRAYGYYAIFGFACIEGEIALLTAGFLAHHQLLSLPYVILVAFVGTLMTEQGIFFIGRFYGQQLLNKFPKLKEKTHIVFRFLHKYDTLFIFTFRFIYGVRNISPLVIGTAGISPRKFSSLNIPAAAIWAMSVAGAGYIFADALQLLINNFERYQKMILLGILAIGGILWGGIKWRRRIHSSSEVTKKHNSNKNV